MNGITVWMAIVDAMPVVVFLLAAIIIMKDQSEEIEEKGIWNYTLLSSGALMLFSGAILKVAWKTLYALNVCDYTTLAESFFPMQTLGFTLMSMGVLGYLCKDKKKATIVKAVYGGLMLVICTFLIVAFSNSAKTGWTPEITADYTEVLVYESHMPFLLGTFIGFMTLQIAMMVLSFKRNAKVYAIAFFFSMIFMIAEALVGSMFDGSSGMHWVAQFIHLFAEIGLYIGARALYKKKHQ